jgi:hypothetical protein
LSARHDSYIKSKDLNMAMKFAARLVVDRARQDGHNPRLGRIEIYFDDDGVGAIWRENEK